MAKAVTHTANKVPIHMVKVVILMAKEEILTVNNNTEEGLTKWDQIFILNSQVILNSLARVIHVATKKFS